MDRFESMDYSGFGGHPPASAFVRIEKDDEGFNVRAGLKHMAGFNLQAADHEWNGILSADEAREFTRLLERLDLKAGSSFKQEGFPPVDTAIHRATISAEGSSASIEWHSGKGTRKEHLALERFILGLVNRKT